MDSQEELRSRLFAFQTLLDGSRDATEQRVEMTTLRKVCASGIPNRPVHLRPLSYNLLLGTLPAEKRSWRDAAKQDREKYYKLVETFMVDVQDAPAPLDPPAERDALLQTISKEVDLASKRLNLLRRRTAPPRRSPLHAPPTDDEPRGSHVESPSESSSSEDSELDESTARVVEDEFAISQTRTKSKGKGKGKAKAVEYLQSRRALFQRLETLAVADHQRQADARRRASGIASSDTSSRKGKGKSVDVAAETEDTGPMLSPRITLSPEPEEQSTMQPFAIPPTSSSRSSSGQTPKLSLTPSDPPTGKDAITLLSPRPIPNPGQSHLSAISGSLLQPETHAECLIRLLYVFCQTHPEWTFKSHFVDIAVPLYLVYLGPNGKERWAEEQTFWALAAILSDLGSAISANESELQPTLDRLARRIKWADYDLYDSLRARNLDPSAPLYTYQWITSLFTNTLPPPAIFPIWDFLLSEAPITATNSPKLDLMLDLCVALLILLKPRLNHAGVVTRRKPGLWGDDDTNGDEGTNDDTFVNGFNLLQSPPLAKVGGVGALLETAFKVRQARKLAGLSGDDPDNVSASSTSSYLAWTPKLPSMPSLAQYAPSLPTTESIGNLSKASAGWGSAARAKLWSTSQAATTSASSATSSIGAAAGRLWGSVRPQEPTPDAAEYDFASSTHTSPELKATSPPPKFVEPKDTIRYNQVPSSVLARREKSEHPTSTSPVAGLTEKLSHLASSFTGSPSADKIGLGRPASGGAPGGPRPLILSGSARRASNSASTDTSGRHVREGSQTMSVFGNDSLSPPSANSSRLVPSRVRGSSESSDNAVHDIMKASVFLGAMATRRTGGLSFLRSITRVMPLLAGRAGLSTSARVCKEGKEQHYPDHVPLNTAQNALLAVGSGIMGVLDTTRGDLVATLSESTASTFLPSLHASMIAHPEGRQIMKDRPIVSSQTVNLDHLKSLKRGTLGREYVEWLERGDLSADSREKVRYIDSPTLAYTMLRYRQTHDLYHTLFSLPPTLVHELSLKVVELSNMSLPVAGLSSTFGPLRLTSARRQLWRQDWVPWALRTGAQGRSLVGVYWEKRWEQGLGELRREMGVSRNDAFGVESRWRGYRELREMERGLRRKGEWVDEPESW